MHELKPRNATEALRAAQRHERAAAIATDLQSGRGDYFVYGQGKPGLYAIYKRSYSNAPDTAYLLDFTGDFPTCTCPDFAEHRDFCKHTLAVKAVFDLEAEQEMCDAYERLHSTAELDLTGCDPYARY